VSTRGAGTASDEAVARAAAGDLGEARRLRDAMAAAGRDRDALAPMLDALGRHAAAGSLAALELVLHAIDANDLARSAVRRLVLDEHAVDDVVQDALVAVARSIGSYRGDARLSTWVHQIARNTAVSHLRRRRDAAPLPDELAGGAARISSMIASRVSIAAVLAELPPAYRDPVVLRDVEQLGYDVIGTRLELPESTVRTRVARGRALVAARLRDA